MITALELAQLAEGALAIGDTKDAAWLALLATDLDDRTGLAYGVLSTILLEVNDEPLGTLSGRWALELGVPEGARSRLERHHRVDLWRRGLLVHRERRPILKLSEVDDPHAFEETSRLAPWIQQESAPWAGLAGAAHAARRMVGALSEAFAVPDTGDENPLHTTTGWEPTPAFAAFSEKVKREGYALSRANGVHPESERSDELVLSDYWLEQEILQLAASGRFEDAISHTKMWAQIRPTRMAPKTALVRIEHAAGKLKDRDATAAAITELPTEDLNELEEARVALGELRLWRQQLSILDRMDSIAPKHPVILANRGVAHIELGEHDAGLADLEAALEADPAFGPALANLGLERMRRDEYVAARRHLERAVEVAPDEALVRVYLAACKNNQNERTGAIAELKKALELEPGHAQATQLLAELEGRTNKPSTN